MRRRTLLRSAAVAATIGGVGVAGASRHRGGRATGGQQPTTEGREMQETTAAGGAFSISTSAWDDGGTIPTRYTCEGENVSPPLSVSNPPEATRTFALVVDDPDAPNPPFVHWLLWNVPADTREIPENVPNSSTIDALGGAVQGSNGTGNLGYVGPCPPEGDPQHTYLFSLFALRAPLDLQPGAGYREVLDALLPKAIARARYVGQYERS